MRILPLSKLSPAACVLALGLTTVRAHAQSCEPPHTVAGDLAFVLVSEEYANLGIVELGDDGYHLTSIEWLGESGHCTHVGTQSIYENQNRFRVKFGHNAIPSQVLVYEAAVDSKLDSCGTPPPQLLSRTVTFAAQQ